MKKVDLTTQFLSDFIRSFLIVYYPKFFSKENLVLAYEADRDNFASITINSFAVELFGGAKKEVLSVKIALNKDGEVSEKAGYSLRIGENMGNIISGFPKKINDLLSLLMN